MNKIITIVASLIFVLPLCSCSKDTKVKTALTQVPFHEVTLDDNFWLPRLQIQKEVLVPFVLDKTCPAVENLRRVGAYLHEGKAEKLLPWPYYVSSDLFKVMEGAAYLLTISPDSLLEKELDRIISIIGKAQKDDGYLYEHHIMPPHLRNADNNGGAGPRPYSWVIHSHELYNMGHMYEGAVAYYRATGKREWLNIAEKSARHIHKVFFEGDSAYNDGNAVNQAPGHEEIELALIKLYQATGDTLYLSMAKRFIDIRGVSYIPDGEGAMSPQYAQQHKPVRKQTTAVGHAVRATYLYSGMADVSAMTGDTTLHPSLEAVWHDIVDHKMHITGGLGAVPGIEGFGPDYVLPNKNTYDETCAAVGNVFFNYRMFLMSRDTRYIDVAEIALYNNVLAGVNLAGNRFFYVNPLEADGRKMFNHGHAGRSPWFGTACCPSNLARLIPQISGMLYSHDNEDIYCSLYAGSSTQINLNSGNVTLHQSTDYPFDGEISIEVIPSTENQLFTLWLRIPTWCMGKQFVPGELYKYEFSSHEKINLSVNGKKIYVDPTDKFVPIKRQWKSGDLVTLSLPMPVQYSIADDRIEADKGRVCITRGPLVYCAEEADNRYPVSSYFLPRRIHELQSVIVCDSGILKGIPYIKTEAKAALYDEECVDDLTLIPYYAWNNRGDKAMNVWFATTATTARAGMTYTYGNIADVRASYTYQDDDAYAMADGKQPSHSHDVTIPRWTAYPQIGKPQVVEITLKQEQPIECVSIYWYNDNGGVRLPRSWSMKYRHAGKWHIYEPYVTDFFGVKADQYNMVHPIKPVIGDALQIHIIPEEEASVGILEVIVE